MIVQSGANPIAYGDKHVLQTTRDVRRYLGSQGLTTYRSRSGV